jgi:transcriptional regulator with XRE-family HTH domain
MTIKLPTIIGANISRKLHAQGITQAEVCRRTGMCKSMLSEIINGHTSHPSVWTMVRISEALGCRVDDLVNIKVQV